MDRGLRTTKMFGSGNGGVLVELKSRISYLYADATADPGEGGADTTQKKIVAKATLIQLNTNAKKDLNEGTQTDEPPGDELSFKKHLIRRIDALYVGNKIQLLNNLLFVAKNFHLNSKTVGRSSIPETAYEVAEKLKGVIKGLAKTPRDESKSPEKSFRQFLELENNMKKLKQLERQTDEVIRGNLEQQPGKHSVEPGNNGPNEVQASESKSSNIAGALIEIAHALHRHNYILPLRERINDLKCKAADAHYKRNTEEGRDDYKAKAKASLKRLNQAAGSLIDTALKQKNPQASTSTARPDRQRQFVEARCKNAGVDATASVGDDSEPEKVAAQLQSRIDNIATLQHYACLPGNSLEKASTALARAGGRLAADASQAVSHTIGLIKGYIESLRKSNSFASLQQLEDFFADTLQGLVSVSENLEKETERTKSETFEAGAEALKAIDWGQSTSSLPQTTAPK